MPKKNMQKVHINITIDEDLNRVGGEDGSGRENE